MEVRPGQAWIRPSAPPAGGADTDWEALGLGDRIRVVQMRVPFLVVAAVAVALALYSEAAY